MVQAWTRLPFPKPCHSLCCRSLLRGCPILQLRVPKTDLILKYWFPLTRGSCRSYSLALEICDVNPHPKTILTREIRSIRQSGAGKPFATAAAVAAPHPPKPPPLPWLRTSLMNESPAQGIPKVCLGSAHYFPKSPG